MIMKKLSTRNGVAIVMVMGFLTMISMLIFSFAYESSVRRTQMWNLNDLEQAKLNAYAGSNLAMSLLDFYAQAVEALQSKSIAIKEYHLEDFIVTTPLSFPIPELPGLSSVQKSAIASFNQDLKMQGSFMIEFESVGGGLNPNNLREITVTSDREEEPRATVNRELFIRALLRKIENKSLQDEGFAQKYRYINIDELVDELIYVVNDRGKGSGVYLSKIDSLYMAEGIMAKHAPLTSLSELYLLRLWDDTLVDLIKGDINIRPNISININKVTKDELMVFFPEMPESSVDIFLKIRDGDPSTGTDPRPFPDLESFKRSITSLFPISKEEYDKKMAMLRQAGIGINTFGQYLKVLVTGIYADTSYQMTLMVELFQEITESPSDKTASTESNAASNTKSKKMNPIITEIIID
jgi:hypothetical protein